MVKKSNIPVIKEDTDDGIIDLRDNKKQETKKMTKKVIGLDLGTMNIVAAIHDCETENTEMVTTRNMFLTVGNNEDADLTDIDHIKSEDNTFIIGEHAYRYSNIFGGSPRRCMEKGLISTSEIDSIDVLKLMISNMIGEGNKGDICVYSVPSNPIDSDLSVIYHERVFGRIITQLGYKAIPLSQALAVIYSQCEEEKFSGIAIDYGSGMTNICLAYRRNPALSFSVTRGGDWIDQNAATSLGIKALGRVTALKEKGTDLMDFNKGNRKEKRIREAIMYYYENLINHSLTLISNKFEDIAESVEIPEELPIIVSGGTSLAKGFLDFFRNTFEEFEEFPIKVKEIRPSEDPLTAVAEGALIFALSKINEEEK